MGKGKTTNQASKRQVADEKKIVEKSLPTVTAENFFLTEGSDDEEIYNPVNSLKSF